MARSRKIKRSRKSKQASVSFLPESLQVFIARRLVDCIALFCLGFGIFMLASLVSYNGSDPSLNTAAAPEGVVNYGGTKGAVLSDILLQVFGLGAYAVAMSALIWGGRIFKRHALRPVFMRVVSIFVAALFLSVALAQLPAISTQGYAGGSVGVLALDYVANIVQPFGIPYGYHFVASLCGVVGAVLFFYGAAFTPHELSTIWFRMKLAAYTIASVAMSVCGGFYRWVSHYNQPEYQGEPVNLGLMDKIRAMKEERAKVEQAKPVLPQHANAAPVKPAKVSVAAKKEQDESPFTPDAPKASATSIPVVKPEASSAANNAKISDTSQQRFALSDVTGEWEFPPISMIQDVPQDAMKPALNEDALRRNAELLQNVLADFKVEGEIVSIHPGPVVTLYELEPAPGTKTSRVISISDDIARSMSAVSVRCAVVSGRNVIGIELPNKLRQTVYMKEMLQSRVFEKTSAKLPLILGKDIGGQPILADLAKMPHLLVAGTTGSGKSVAVNTMIMSLLYRLSPEQCRFIMIDPKMLELSVYDDIPHLLTPVVTEPTKAIVALKWAVREMEDRYRAMSKLGVRNIEGYNQRVSEAIKNDEQIMQKVQTGFDPDTGKPTFEDQAMELAEFPYIVIIVDEFADLMLVAGKDVENAIQRLAQMARAAGLHLIMATQRPSVDVITGVVKANFPTRISFQVTSKIDSRTILGDGGAEQLLGMGDMLYMAPGGRITRVHGPFVSDEDVEKTTNFLRSQAKPSYIEDVTSEDGDFGGSDVMNAMFGGADEGGEKVDELYDQAVAVIAREGKVSTSFVQRHLQIGYNRAARIVEEMERQGVISAASSTGKRTILVTDFSDV